MKVFEITTGFKFWNPFHLLAFGLGSGFMRPGPGTWGTALAVPIVFLINSFAGDYYLIITFTTFLIGWWCCEIVTRELGIADHKSIVIDEWVGLLIAMIFVPVTWLGLLYGFLSFRVFDIFKVGPVAMADKRIKGSFGIMFDDVLAGLIAGVIGFMIFKQ